MEEVLNTFIATTTGKSNLGDTTQNKGECVGLIELWLDTLNINDPHLWGNAIDLLNNADPTKFQIVYNKFDDTSQFPPDGAISVLGKPYGVYIQNGELLYAGHTGLSKGSDGTTLRLWEQNDPIGAAPQLKEYSYVYCIGWLIPIITIQGGDTVDQNTINQTKAVQFDESLQVLTKANSQIFPTDDSGQYLSNSGHLTAINAFITDYQSQKTRAGEWDQLCLKLGLTGDSAQITVQQILDKLQPVSRMAELEQIRDIAIKALA